MRAGHRPYIAHLGPDPVAYGWSATCEAEFGGLQEFKGPPANRYLWDFATLPAWRGLGIYPRLLQTIVAREAGDAERFWILNQLGNSASASGITKAAFHVVGEVVFLIGGGLGLVPIGRIDRARAGAELLGLRLIGGEPVE